ncbi:MAG: hypothetical protein COB04_02785 [Gammaproteobacteria bacterium]|nr:MAG: hypothetical protein COB04_02785 [Gammaproteobacteria bacterium]
MQLKTNSSSLYAFFVASTLHLAVLFTLIQFSDTDMPIAEDALPASISIRHITLQQSVSEVVPDTQEPPTEAPAIKQETTPEPIQEIEPETLAQETPKVEPPVEEARTPESKIIKPLIAKIPPPKKTQPEPPKIVKQTVKEPPEKQRPLEKTEVSKTTTTSTTATSTTETSTTETQNKPNNTAANLAQQTQQQTAVANTISPDSAYYFELLASIEKNKYYPLKAKKRDQQGEVIIQFSIQKDGTLTDIKVIGSSGFFTLDKAALRAVKKLKKFKPLPAAIALNSTTLKIPMQYTII